MDDLSNYVGYGGCFQLDSLPHPIPPSEQNQDHQHIVLYQWGKMPRTAGASRPWVGDLPHYLILPQHILIFLWRQLSSEM